MIALAQSPAESKQRTVTVNAAFLEDIKNDHVEFTDMLNATAAAVCPGSGNRTKPSGLAEILAELRDQLAMHFALEDAVGYFDDPLEADYRLCEEAAMLQSQHKELYEFLCRITNRAEEWKYGERDFNEESFDQLAVDFQLFVRMLRTHEDSERKLIMDSFWLDLGVGD